MNLDPFLIHMIEVYENHKEFAEGISSSFTVKVKDNSRYKIKINLELIDLETTSERA